MAYISLLLLVIECVSFFHLLTVVSMCNTFSLCLVIALFNFVYAVIVDALILVFVMSSQLDYKRDECNKAAMTNYCNLTNIG